MIKYHNDIEQGTDEWFAARCGLLTASEMKLIITPKTLKACNNDNSRAHLYELAAQRITGYVEPHYVSDDMLRGTEDELDAKIIYNEKYEAVQETGFVTNDKWGFTIGYSPDGLVGEDGLIEAKSRRQKFQIETITESISAGRMPDDFIIQVQTGLLVSERKWCDFISYSGGLPMATVRILPDPQIQDAIVIAAEAFEKSVAEKIEKYNNILKSDARLIPTKRKPREEITI